MTEQRIPRAELPVIGKHADGWNAWPERGDKPLFTRSRPTREELVADLRGLGYRVALEAGGEVQL